jgi:hypothetical protein
MSSILTDKSTAPDDKILSGVLGRSFNSWIEIKASIQERHGAAREEWKYYGATSGWVLKFLIKKRNMFFMIPGEKHFTLGFVFGDRAVGAIEQSKLPDAMIREVKEAKRYAEGRGLRIDIRNRTAIRNVLTLVDIKVQN